MNGDDVIRKEKNGKQNIILEWMEMMSSAITTSIETLYFHCVGHARAEHKQKNDAAKNKQSSSSMVSWNQQDFQNDGTPLWAPHWHPTTYKF